MSDQQKLEALERLTAAVSELKAMFEYDTAIQAADLSTERNAYTLSPIQGQTFVGASQVFTISDIGPAQWRIRASVGTQSSFEDGDFFDSGDFVDESQSINVTGIVETGQLITIEISVGNEFEHSISYRSYVSNRSVDEPVEDNGDRIQSLLNLTHGYGRNATGGKNGVMTLITSLTDNSLLNALTDNVARWIHFHPSLDGQTWNSPQTNFPGPGDSNIEVKANKTLDGRDALITIQLGDPDSVNKWPWLAVDESGNAADWTYKPIQIQFTGGNCIAYGIHFRGDLLGTLEEGEGGFNGTTDIEIWDGEDYFIDHCTFENFSDEALSVYPNNGGAPNLITFSHLKFIDNKNDSIIGKQDYTGDIFVTQYACGSTGAAEGRTPGLYYSSHVHLYNSASIDYRRQGIQVWNNAEVISENNVLSPGVVDNPHTLRFAGSGGGATTGVPGKLNDSGSLITPSTGTGAGSDLNYSHDLNDMFSVDYSYTLMDASLVESYIQRNSGAENADRSGNFSLEPKEPEDPVGPVDPEDPVTSFDLGAYPRLVPYAQGYGLSNNQVMPLIDVRVCNSLNELINNLGDNRVLLPNFSGWHQATSQINMGYNNLLIPGQVAPGQGFGIYVGSGSNNLLNIGGANRLVLQHFRLAPGSDGADGNVDPIRTESAPNGSGGAAANQVLIDHMHLYWGRDQLASVWYNSSDVVFKDTAIGPTTTVNSGRGPIIGSNSTNVLMYRCLLPGNKERNPFIKGALASLVNCAIVGWESEPIVFGTSGGSKGRGNVVNNRFINGPKSDPTNRGEVMLFEDNGSGAGFDVHLSGNIGVRQSNPNGDQSIMLSSALGGVAYYPTLGNYTPPNTNISSSIVGGSINVDTMLASQVDGYVYENVGPVPNRRDSKMQDIISKCQAGSMVPDTTGATNDLPELSSGPSRLDESRADKIGAEFREEVGMPESANGLVDKPDGSDWPWIFHFFDWCARYGQNGSVSPYSPLDVEASQDSFVVKDQSGNVVNNIFPGGLPYTIEIDWVDSNGDYAGSGAVQGLETTIGRETFNPALSAGSVGGVTNVYDYVSPDSQGSDEDAIFTWGVPNASGFVIVATASVSVSASSSSNNSVEAVRISGSDFTSRLTLSDGQPAKLWYRIQGETSYTERVPYEMSSNHAIHNQAAPGTESKTLPAGSVIEYFWRYGESLESQTSVQTITLSQTSSKEGEFTNVIDLDSIGTVSQGSWTREKWEEVFGSRAAYTPTNMSHLSIINDNGKHKIRQRHQASSQGTARIIAPFNIPESNEVRIIQTIEVDSNFTWGTTGFSGKLGWGFGGGQNTSGGASDPKGFTGRISWDDDGELAFYSYAANRQNGGNASFGEEIGTGFHITPGVPFTVEMHATMNSSFGSSDGTFKMWVNGNLELDLVGIGWQTQAFGNETAPHIDRIAYSQFHGGADGRWSPTTSPTYANNYDMSWE